MKPQKLFGIGGLAVSGIIVGILATSGNDTPGQWMKIALLETLSVTPAVVQANQIENSERGLPSLQVAKDVRRAAKRKPPGAAQLSPAPSGQMRSLSKAELLDICQKRPRCRAKLQAAQKRGSNKPRPAMIGKSREAAQLRSLPPGQMHPLSKAELLDACRKQLQCREKLRTVPKRGSNKPVTPKPRRGQPRSDLMSPEDTKAALLSWLNPFQVDPVYALSAPFKINLKPAGPIIKGSYMELWGASVSPGNIYVLQDTVISKHGAKAKGFLHFQVPATGTYIINVRSTWGEAKLHSKHKGIIDTWNFTGQPNGYYNYVTIMNLTKGVPANIYFSPLNHSNLTVYGVSLTKYL